MQPRSADSFRKKDLPQRRKGRQGTQRGKSYWLLVIGYWLLELKKKPPLHVAGNCSPSPSLEHSVPSFAPVGRCGLAAPTLPVAGASCSRPSMERPAPCFEWPLKKQIQRLIIRRTFRECICRASGNFSKPRSGLGMAGAKQRHMGPCL